LEIGDISDTQNPVRITIVTDAIALAGDTLIRVKRPNTGSISLPAGAAVIFDSIDIGISYTQMVSIVENVYIDGNTPEADLFINVAPLTELLPDGAIAVTVNGLLPLFGVQSFDFQSQETSVDVTSSQSGSGMESAMVRFNRSISVSGVQMEGDRTVETLLKPRVFSQWGDDKELYAIATYPDGSKYEGPAKVLNFNMAGNQNEVMRYEFTLQFQRDIQRKSSILPFANITGWGGLDLGWGGAVLVW
jgi:predicted secreted protein